MHRSFFDSKLLGKDIYMADISELTRGDLKILRRELETAVHAMKEKQQEEEDPADLDWSHRLSFKLRICKQFLTRVKQVQEDEMAMLEEYHLIYFRQAVATLVGPLKADRLYEASRQSALRQIQQESDS